MNDAGQHVGQGTESRSLAPSSTDLLRVALLLIALAVIAFRCYKQFLLNQEVISNPVVYLHLRSLDGYRAGTPVYIGKHLPSRPKSFIVIPSRSEDLSRQRALWSSAISTEVKGFPVIVCLEQPCPLSESEQSDPDNRAIVLDRLQYIPAFAVAQAAQNHQVLMLNPSMIVRKSVAAPETQADARALLEKEIR